MLRAIYLRESGAPAEVTTLPDSAYAEVRNDDVTVTVEYSSLNYKDALAITARSRIVRKFPMVPGIDYCGTVMKSRDARWKVGDRVIVNGWGAGEDHWGGMSQRATASGDWLVACPSELSGFKAMAIGTAGYTAMLCVNAIEAHGVSPKSGLVAVTGASGGVGSFAIAILAKLGYEVVAFTGRTNEESYLRKLGASQVLHRSELSENGKPLGKEKWIAAIDSVGSHTLANLCAQTCYGGVVATCGLAQGMDFPATVAPFILRGVTLCGIDSVYAPGERRIRAWRDICRIFTNDSLELIAQTIALKDAIPMSDRLLNGDVRGRLVIDVNA
jgi:acrylyl-CoA reductase (NADPH)